MADFEPVLKFPLGPYNLMPNWDPSIDYPANIFRTIGGQNRTRILGIEGDNKGTTGTIIGTDFTISGADESGVWHPICGFPIIEVDGMGTETPTGYIFAWQYHVNSYTAPTGGSHPIGYAQVSVRVITQKIEDPLDITVIATNTSSIGGLGGVTNCRGMIVGFNYYHTESGNAYLYHCVGFGWYGYNNNNVRVAGRYCTIGVSEEWFNYNSYKDPIVKIDDPNEQDPGGESGEGGGDGGFNRDSDSNPIPGLPSINATDAGFVKLYYVTDEVLHLVASEVYSSNFFDWLKDVFMKPTDLICGIAIVPYIPALGSRGSHSFGGFQFTTKLTSISTPYKVINCGSITIDKYYGSAFDFSPYTDLQIFLPFIGMKQIDVDEVMGRTISVTYHCDTYTGACVAFLTTPINNVDSVIAQYSGNILQQVPFGAGDFSQIVAATLSVATAVTGSIAAGGAAGAALAKDGATAAQVVSGAATAAGESAPSISDAMANVMSIKPRVEKASIAAGSAGQMSSLKPYILRRVPRQSLPANYKALNGYPSNIGGKLGSFSGYTEIQTIQLSGVNLTEPEIAEILSILKGGVII